MLHFFPAPTNHESRFNLFFDKCKLLCHPLGSIIKQSRREMKINDYNKRYGDRNVNIGFFEIYV